MKKSHLENSNNHDIPINKRNIPNEYIMSK